MSRTAAGPLCWRRLWLLLGALFALIASLKFHNPHFLASESYLTYGRVHAAHETALLYGFGLQVGLGVGLWLLCRLGRTRWWERELCYWIALLEYGGCNGSGRDFVWRQHWIRGI